MSAALPPALRQTFDDVRAVASAFTGPWWIIGSAAVVLVGASADDVRDVDILFDRDADFDALARALGDAEVEAAAPSAMFRSRRFARYVGRAVPVEAFSGFEMATQGAWRPVRPQTRVFADGLPVPALGEQIALLTAMGRAKDGPRLAALAALSAGGL